MKSYVLVCWRPRTDRKDDAEVNGQDQSGNITYNSSMIFIFVQAQRRLVQ